jgi:uncharacterized protein
MEDYWKKAFLNYFQEAKHDLSDASHDLSHFLRVATMAKQIALIENEPVDPLVILAAAYFHDLVSLPKNHPESKFSSRFSAEKARVILSGLNFPKEKINAVCHAIEAHSFSAQLTPETIEAKIIQDADRMEALGALGVMRTFYVSGRLKTAPYHPTDLFGKGRPLDDKAYALDHFYCKLFKLPDMLQTKGGREVALKRTHVLHTFVEELSDNIKKGEGGALLVVKSCYEAGFLDNVKLFDQCDIFAEKRPLASEKFVIDRLIESKRNFPKFIESFLKQLKEEI